MRFGYQINQCHQPFVCIGQKIWLTYHQLLVTIQSTPLVINSRIWKISFSHYSEMVYNISRKYVPTIFIDKAFYINYPWMSTTSWNAMTICKVSLVVCGVCLSHITPYFWAAHSYEAPTSLVYFISIKLVSILELISFTGYSRLT